MRLNKGNLVRTVDLIMQYSGIPKNQRNFNAIQSQITLSRKEYVDGLGKTLRSDFENRSTVRTEAKQVRVNFQDPVITAIIQMVYEGRKINQQQVDLLRRAGVPVSL